ncbi:MAG: DUF1499 domain-containing protein, partial [Bacteroidota bacterium]
PSVPYFRYRMAADYARQKTAPEYAAFAAKTQVFGVWDDHDYGINDGGKEWPHQAAAKALMLDFLDVPADAPVRNYAGAYQTYDLEKNGLTVRVFLLDTRSFRDALAPPTREGHRYGASKEGDVLGEEQWAWLAEQLAATEGVDFVLVASSIQVLPEEHGYEKWANFPTARQRLLDLLADADVRNVLLLSGDRHLAEISRVTHRGLDVHELTASGLTHSYEAADEPNQHRLSPLIGKKNYGLLHFFPGKEGTQVLAEVRSITTDATLARLALGPDAEVEQLSQSVQPSPTIMPNELQPCPASPNCVSTQTDQADKKREPIAYSGSLAEAKAKLMKVIANLSRTKLQREEDNYLHYTFKTFPIPFTDDVEFVFDDAAKVIHYRSASRVGHSDLGVNSKRMAKVVTAFNEQ